MRLIIVGTKLEMILQRLKYYKPNCKNYRMKCIKICLTRRQPFELIFLIFDYCWKLLKCNILYVNILYGPIIIFGWKISYFFNHIHPFNDFAKNRVIPIQMTCGCLRTQKNKKFKRSRFIIWVLTVIFGTTYGAITMVP